MQETIATFVFRLSDERIRLSLAMQWWFDLFIWEWFRRFGWEVTLMSGVVFVCTGFDLGFIVEGEIFIEESLE